MRTDAEVYDEYGTVSSFLLSGEKSSSKTVLHASILHAFHLTMDVVHGTCSRASLHRVKLSYCRKLQIHNLRGKNLLKNYLGNELKGSTVSYYGFSHTRSPIQVVPSSSVA